MAKCTKCGKEYPPEIKYCTDDGTKIISKTLNNSSDDFEKTTITNKSANSNLSVFVFAVLSIIPHLYIILSFFSHPQLFAAGLVGGKLNFFLLYLKGEVMGWIIAALILSGIAKFIDGVYVDNENKTSETGASLASMSLSLASIFLVLGLLSNVIVGY
jgi:Putative silver efflux pump